MHYFFLSHTVRISALLTAMLLFTGSLSSTANAGLNPKQISTKTLRVRPNSSALNVQLEPLKDSYWVDEPIRLKSKGNKPYYLYLFNVDPKTGEAILILPNKLQTDNYYSYSTYLVPNRVVEFYSDRPGTEQIIMVASSKAFNIALDKYKSIGDFVTGQSAEFEKSLGIRFHAPEQTAENPDVVVKTVAVHIKGQRQQARQEYFNSQSGTPAASRVDDPVAFISTAYNEYFDGDQFYLVYGANRPGYVHLYSIEPSGAYDLLKVAAVDGRTINTLKLKAVPPYGLHALVAIYSDKQSIDHHKIASLNYDMDKSLLVIGDSRQAVAVHRIQIRGY